ncbi:UNVERIFIED_CONTAM: quercetin dioxygenase-like cupin family protein [Brevibacillus sp. OAP136]
MQLFRFDPAVMRTIEMYGSKQVGISPIIRVEGRAQIGCLHFAENSLVGFHPAVGKQLFLVVQGEGWVRAGGTEVIRLRAGEAAFWEDGEGHESGSDSGMTVIVIEGPDLNPAAFMRSLGLEQA